MRKTFKLLIFSIILPAFAGFIFCCGFHTRKESEKYEITLLSAYTTYFDGENEARSHNIRLAASFIDGKKIEGGEIFSFNGVVGQRTAERGFMKANIIENGEFVEGVGGGVCQVSTTLYNCALLAGCRAVEYHPHSLPVSYVPPSRDAMVSGNSFDLKLKNEGEYPLYILSETGKNFVKFKIYGKDDGKRYSLSSEIKQTIPAEEEFTDNESLVRSGKDGIISEGYMTISEGEMQRIIFLRRDRYLPQKKISLRREEEAEISQNNLPF